MALAELAESPLRAVRPELAPRPAGAFYRPELDGLRFLCFLAVFIGHSFPLNPLRSQIAGTWQYEAYAWLWCVPQAGGAGVDVFFTLSSFLITELLLRETERTGRIDVPAFYCRRALRIWPLYYAFLLLAWFAERPLGLPGLDGPTLTAFVCFGGNWDLAWTGEIPRSATQILWTVSIEEQFYLLWPLLLFLCGVKRIVPLAVAILALANASRLALLLADANWTMTAFSTPTRMDGIAAGALLAVALRRWPLTLPLGVRRLLFAVGLLLPVVVHRYIRLSPSIAGAELLACPLVAVAAVLLLVGSLRHETERSGLLTDRTIVYLGKISYGLYVWHLACILMTYKLGWSRPGQWTTLLYGLPLTIAAAAASYRWLELPFLKWKRAFTHVASREEAAHAGAGLGRSSG